ncbi:MAG: PEP-utilizing enzyme [Gemmatales bacterium]|nr:PEP-utilizing enzyme [Gemmatales bacterium]MDW8387658.1 PEP/pyruvate-binding domain-containing protein [Gemmatales bacterium]
MTPIIPFDSIEPHQLSQVGGKGLSLGLMTRAGLPVPPGFVLPAQQASNPMYPEGEVIPETERQALVEAYRRLGAGPVAVRSSALAEDSEDTSFAGQQETLLNVLGESALLDAVVRCRNSIHSQRAEAYRQRQDVAEEKTALAVVVQRMVPAEVSGVLFTRDPLDPTGERMLIEASWGLGESVVSGRVVPDRFHCRRDDGRLVEQHIGTKKVQLGPDGWHEVPPERQREPCLTSTQLAELVALGRQVEAYFGEARDVEWAYAEGRFWLLQARPITTPGAFEREELIRSEIAALKAKTDPRGTVWARYNLAEILPTPTPMTWAVVRRFMSGRGGYGLLFRDLGFDPDPELDEEGFIDLICGRPYVNLSREPKLYFRDFPIGHRFDDLKSHPDRAIYPKALPDASRITARFLLRLPIILWKVMRNHSQMTRQMRIWADVLRQQVYPQFLGEVEAARRQDLDRLSAKELIERFEHWNRRTLEDFARRSVRPSAFAALAMANLEQALKIKVGPEEAGRIVREAMAGSRPDPEADVADALARFLTGKLSREEFLRDFGHRGPNEMELAEPRWGEKPELLPRPETMGSVPLPSLTHQPDAETAWETLLQKAGLSREQARALRTDFDLARTYTGLRETSKHYLLMGYALMRQCLVELDRRFRLRGGIFFLQPDELHDLASGKDLRTLIRQRRRHRQIALSIELPTVLFSDDLGAIGRTLVPWGAGTLNGTPLSAGVAEGPALVLTQPEPVGDRRDFILVCPSTDPGWVPLFVHARGLVMESGGVLSHGAIVAREFRLPAVGGVPDVANRIRTGQRLKVDGNTGKVYLLGEPG